MNKETLERTLMIMIGLFIFLYFGGFILMFISWNISIPFIVLGLSLFVLINILRVMLDG